MYTEEELQRFEAELRDKEEELKRKAENLRQEQELLNAQLERIHTLFRRQLAVPLMGEHDALTVQTGCKMDWTHVAKAVCHNPPEKTVKYLIWKSNAAMRDDLSGFGCDVSIKMLCIFRKRTALLLRFVTGVNKRQPDGLVEPNGEQRHFCYFWNPFSLVELFTEVWGSFPLRFSFFFFSDLTWINYNPAQFTPCWNCGRE